MIDNLEQLNGDWLVAGNQLLVHNYFIKESKMAVPVFGMAIFLSIILFFLYDLFLQNGEFFFMASLTFDNLDKLHAD